MSITVNILANNEERTIRSSIDSVINQTIKPDQLVVVANGCTDNTSAIARKYAEVIEIEEASKPVAWNAARRMCNTTYISFMDGDAALKFDTLEKQLKHLSGKLSAVGGITASYTDELDWLSKFGAEEYIISKYLPGVFYTCKLKDLNLHLKRRGFEDMPEDIINEDHWITLVIGKGNYEIVHDSVVYCVPASWKDRYQQKQRVKKGSKQIKSGYHALCNEFNQGERKIRGHMFNRFRHAKDLGPMNGSLYFFKYILNKIAVYSAGVLSLNNNQKWNSASSTKIAIPKRIYSDKKV